MEENNNILGNESTQEQDNLKKEVESFKERADVDICMAMFDIVNNDLGKKVESIKRSIDDCKKKTQNPNISPQRMNELLKKQINLHIRLGAYYRIINVVNLKLLEESSALRTKESVKENSKDENNNTTEVS
jgi:hypothetical protein